MNVKRGELYYADLSPVVGSEQGGVRPCLIVQNDVGNKYSPTTILAPLTTRKTKAVLPTHVNICHEGTGLKSDSLVLLEQVRIIDKERLLSYLGHLDDTQMKNIDIALAKSIGLIPLGGKNA